MAATIPYAFPHTTLMVTVELVIVLLFVKVEVIVNVIWPAALVDESVQGCSPLATVPPESVKPVPLTTLVRVKALDW